MDLTVALAVLQTIAGFGAIAATIVFTAVQSSWAWRDEMRRKVEFVSSARELIDLFDQATDALIDENRKSPGDAMVGVGRWVETWANVRDSMAALRDHSLSDAPTIMRLSASIRVLDNAQSVQNARSRLDLCRQADFFRSELHELGYELQQRGGELQLRLWRVRAEKGRSP